MDEDPETRLNKRVEERREKMRKDAVGMRFRLVRQCSCVSDGWGCCCARPLVAVPDDNGDHIVLYLPEVAR